ncbi:hypothetical protein OZ401_004614 (plasmid) [Candidatus Chlorohelix allophototropha]|uniref:Uncharacterized protein n=2 Tax=Candidatus Chlorohelix allophototropha TaxID=3003348 RepID=A0ABY9BAI0_9CHLR|nr:hypothetical protein OZ401_004614 [Chloroflexota bacterium L227-S17]
MKHNTYYIRWGSSLMLLLTLSLSMVISNSTLAAEGSQFFPETKHTVSGKFLEYWNNNGGLPTFGYPITDAQMETDPETGKTFLTQWFERHRLELHPENAGTKFEVLTGLLGKEINRTKLATEPGFQKATQLYDPAFSKDQQWYFTETGHNLGFGFLKYWQDNGGLERFGYPISEYRRELDPETGKPFMMQWFERARFEYHPENQKPYDILLGLLGKQIKGSNSIAVETPTPNPSAVPPTVTPLPTFIVGPLRPQEIISAGSGIFARGVSSDGMATYTQVQLDTYYFKIQRIRVEENPNGCGVAMFNADKVWFSSSSGTSLTINDKEVGTLQRPVGKHGYVYDSTIHIGDKLCQVNADKRGFQIIFGPDIWYHYDSYCYRGNC